MKRKLFSRVRTLLIPYVLWNLFYLIFWLIAEYTGWTDKHIDLSPLTILKNIVTYEYMSHFWFLANLLIYVAVTPALYFVLRYKAGRIAAPLVVISAIFASNAGLLPGIPLFGTDWFLFFLVAGMLAVTDGDALRREYRKLTPPLCLAGAAVGIALTYFAYRMNIWLLRDICILITFAAGWGALDLIDWDRFRIREWMKATFVLYAWHGMVCSFVSKVIVVGTGRYMLAYAGYILIGVPLIFGMDAVIKRVVPHVRNAFAGGRG